MGIVGRLALGRPIVDPQREHQENIQRWVLLVAKVARRHRFVSAVTHFVAEAPIHSGDLPTISAVV
jgi:hypothetical protein